MTGRTRDLPVFPLSAEPIRPDVHPDVMPVRHEIEVTGEGDGLRIALVTLGCDKNTVDSERMMAALVGYGARVSSDVTGAEVAIVNTCGFIEQAKEQSIETILDACELKGLGELKAVVAVGCLVERHGSELAEEIPEVDLFLGLGDLPKLIPKLRGLGYLPELDESIPAMERPLRILSTETPHTSYLKISEGCDHTCAFCAIPLMRGLHRSHPVDELVREAAGLGEAGVRELNIVSQDTTWYGRDLRRHRPDAPDLSELLHGLLNGTDIPWYRLFYMYPSGITRGLVELVAAESRILPYLDMPIQHGSDRVLELMRRPERRKTILERIAWLRDSVPDLTLRTTVIVGFPGETEEDFQQMLDLLEEIQFERVGAFTYSVEEGTRAAGMGGRIPVELMSERLEELMEVQRDISFEKNAALVGTSATALVDEILDQEEGYLAIARTQAQALDIDGVTRLIGSDPIQAGDLIKVQIIDALDYDLVAEVQGA
ncbi:MAG: 30S ribosomal protein S12 methylthiotransferase RimO [Gemmatimonadota bacterium]|jgi:ribosomal protein S12 methylthiotransferase|nr:30S ribosomal protein S12 methylthiotransferase RimO [Gemmatimonadota bacterium]|tara:strand:+ start:4266 stop:5726 length:1461 start_codon:yes stop_codon:yes gene_type:complete